MKLKKRLVSKIIKRPHLLYEDTGIITNRHWAYLKSDDIAVYLHEVAVRRELLSLESVWGDVIPDMETLLKVWSDAESVSEIVEAADVDDIQSVISTRVNSANTVVPYTVNKQYLDFAIYLLQENPKSKLVYITSRSRFSSVGVIDESNSPIFLFARRSTRTDELIDKVDLWSSNYRSIR